MKYYHSSSFKLFFKNLYISTPRTLNNIKSLIRLKGLTPIHIFLNYINRHGKKHTFSKLILSSFIYNFHKSTNFFNTRWQLTFITFINFFQNSNSYSYNLNNFKDDLQSNINNVTINYRCLSILKNLNLIFSFYIHKVDKHIYKNSRGKSGKFTFI